MADAPTDWPAAAALIAIVLCSFGAFALVVWSDHRLLMESTGRKEAKPREDA